MPKIEKILKKQEDGTKKTIYPATICQAIRDGKTGASLEALLSQFNSIYVQYNGTAFDTRNLIPERMRRAGLVITYMNMDSETITERAVSAVQADNDHWGLDVNWTRIDQFTLSGRITISSEGTWLVDGEDTGIKAVGPKGDTGLTPWLKTIDNKLHFSYDNVTWEPCSENIAAWFRFNATSSDSQAGTIGRIQISRDNKTWTDLSPEFRNYLRIQGYVATTSALPANQVVGTIYGVGPTYAADDTAQTNPIYRLHVWNGTSWVDNGQFTSIAAGVVQETGDSETEVMSQKAVSTKLSELGSEMIKSEEYQNIESLADIYDGYYKTTGQFTYSDNWKGFKIQNKHITKVRCRVYSNILTAAAVVFFNSEGNIFSTIPFESDGENLFEFDISNDTAYFVISSRVASSADYYIEGIGDIKGALYVGKKAVREENLELGLRNRLVNLEEKTISPIISKIINYRYSISSERWIYGKSIFFEISGKKLAKIGTSTNGYYAFFDSFDFNATVGIFNESTPQPISSRYGIETEIPSNAKYLYIQLWNEAQDNTPTSLEVDGINCSFDGSISPSGTILEKVINLVKDEGNSNASCVDFIGLSNVVTCSHRGKSAIECPENSIHSITNAYHQGIKIVECDVAFTSDGIPVVIHDSTIDRTMNTIDDERVNSSIAVSSLTLDELSTRYIYRASVEKYKTRICTFYEWLERVKELKLIPLLHNISADLIPLVKKYVGEKFIYMSRLENCLAVRKQSEQCFIIYQRAAQQDSETGIISDENAVISDMLKIGGMCAYSSLSYSTFTDSFIEAIKENGLYWQYSTDAPNYTSDAIARGANMILTNNWCNNQLSYRPLYRMTDDIEHDTTENGMPKITMGKSTTIPLSITGTNIRLTIVCKGSVSISIDGVKSSFGGDVMKAYQFGVNTIATNIDVSITADTDLTIGELFVEES